MRGTRCCCPPVLEPFGWAESPLWAWHVLWKHMAGGMPCLEPQWDLHWQEAGMGAGARILASDSGLGF